MLTISFIGGTFEATEIAQVLQEIVSAPDRSTAIVGGALVEKILSDRLIEHLHPDAKLTKRLFKPSGALGAFHTKINLAKLVGMCSDALHDDIIRIKDVRNIFAHRLDVKSFEHPDVKALCVRLSLCDRHTIEATQKVDQTSPAQAIWRVGIGGRDAMLRSARGRFLASISVSTAALNLERGLKMPTPPA